MRPLNYILDEDHIPRPIEDVLEWARWLEQGKNVITQTEVDDVLVSTVFLGLDYNHLNIGPPILFETMIFAKGPGDLRHGYGRRYATWEEAETGHRETVERVTAGTLEK